RFFCVCIAAALIAAVPARAVYAPIPQQEQGKALSAYLRGGLAYDSNIFGAPNHEIHSWVYSVAPRLKYNQSVTDQLFVSAGYELDMDYFDNRPGTKALFSHLLDGRAAYAFSPVTSVDLSDTYNISKNPSALLAGVPVNTNQSFKSNEFDGRLLTNPLPKAGLVLKFRSLNYRYDDNFLASELDRTESVAGLEGNYAVLPELKAAAEYRYQDIRYDTAGGTKNKNSNFFLVGADYALGKQYTASARVGAEQRHRDGQRNTTAPYAELSGKYDYAERSFVSAGYAYSLEEVSDVITFTDEKVNQFFLNLQHAVSALVIASASVDYEPAVLEARRGFRNANEDTTRAGLALTYLPTKNWTITVSYDYDRVSSDVKSRELTRHRTGLTATYSF
ncbi:MAG TPA: outer membrane beta-barrel protein, partial [Opitutaceae bacterium]|nr:outer membrane beta-barrel protein [Opitutaceae bacterium]